MKIKFFSLASGSLSLLALAYIYFPESIDDAYITLRYSKNFLLGNGPVFNVGEKVEGFSNFSWMVLLAAIGQTGIPMEIAMKFISVASGLGSLFFVWKLSVNWFKSDTAVGAAVILLGTSSFFAVWSVDGLETSFYTLLLTSLVYLLTTKEINACLVGVLAAVVALTRPEGIMFSLIAVAYLAFRNQFAAAVKALAVVAVCAGSYEVFRLFYFGEYVSNTALAKVHPSLDTIKSGFTYLYEYNAASGYLVLPVALFGMMGALKNTQLSIPILFILAQSFFLMVSGGDFMFAYRFVVPVIPCIILLCAAAIDIWDKRLSGHIAIGAAITLSVSQAFFQYASLPQKHFEFDNLTFRSSPHFEIAKFIAKNTGSSDWVLLSEAGIIPYYIDAKVVDYLGLTSPFKSVYKLDRTIDYNYIFSNKPKFVVISFTEDQHGSVLPRMGVEREILTYPEFRLYYKQVHSFDLSKNTSFLNNIYFYYSPDAKRIFFAIYERM
jgi:hypothetical protein